MEFWFWGFTTETRRARRRCGTRRSLTRRRRGARIPGGDVFSRAYGVSADGSVIVGQGVSASGHEAFRWKINEGMVGLGDLPGGSFMSIAYGASADGSVIVGGGTVASTSTHSIGILRAFRWTASLGMVSMGVGESTAFGVSQDGSVIVGANYSSSYGTQPVRWTNGDDMAILTNYLVSGMYARAVSANGSVIVGGGHEDPPLHAAFRWTSSQGLIGLGSLNGSNFDTNARAISADGAVVAGDSSAYGYQKAFRWTQNDGMAALGDLPGEFLASEANGVSANGSIIIGRAQSSIESVPFIWDSNNGMRVLQEVLQELLSPTDRCDLDEWRLINATAISADGQTVVGYGVNPSGNSEAWVAYLGNSVPEPSGLSIALFCLLLIFLSRSHRSLLGIGEFV